MTSAHPTIPLVYLLELLDTPDGLTEHCEPFRKLDLAVEAGMSYLAKAYPGVVAEADVSYDPDGCLEGISYFNEDMQRLVVITVYHLDRETESPLNAEITLVCQGDASQLQDQLNRLLCAPK